MNVIKRDKSVEIFDFHKIFCAIEKAANACNELIPINDLTKNIVARLNRAFAQLEVETIQDYVELELMHSYPNVAKAYILYRAKRAELRAQRKIADPQILADFIHASKYARHLPNEKRRETYLETTNRVRDMHIRKFPLLTDEICRTWELVEAKRVLPSMRSMQFGGAAIEQCNERMYNCSFTHIDRPRVFQEIFFLLLCGCGVGYSVQFKHVKMLPEVKRIDTRLVRHHSIEDDIIGWADAIGILMDSYFIGYYVEFNYEKIRPEGSPLITTGGRAPGHMPLRKLIERLRLLLDCAANRQLRPLECHDTICHIAKTVLAGGIRRSSLISLFSPDDGEMMYCKQPENLQTQRAMANNSVVFLRKGTSYDLFKRIMELNRNSHGEPGFFFTNHLDYGCNPCGEIGLNPKCNGKTGFGFCNLTEINCALTVCEDDFYEAVEAATFIGTLQAAYTDFPYLGEVTEIIAKRDALLGVSLTGMMDNPNIALNAKIQRQAVALAKITNEIIAKKIKILPAMRLTCIKPSGTASLELGGVSSGIHSHHAKRYFRRIIANPLEPIAQYLKEKNPQMVEIMPNGEWSLIFPIETKGIVDISTIDFLKEISSTFLNWVKPGSLSDLTHNVSCTVVVDNWEETFDWVWKNRDNITAMTFLPKISDKNIPFCPREAVTTEIDEIKWQNLISKFKPIDYSCVFEEIDMTVLESACEKDSCSSVPQISTAPGVNLCFDENPCGEIVSSQMFSYSGSYHFVKRAT